MLRGSSVMHNLISQSVCPNPFRIRHLCQIKKINLWVFQQPEKDTQTLSCDHVQPWHIRVGHLSDPERLLSTCFAALFKLL